MGISATTVLIIILSLSAALLISGGRSSPPKITVGDTGYYLKVYNAINTFRSKHVSPSVKWNRTLNDIAETLALQMAREVSEPDPEDMEGVNYFGISGPRPSSFLVVSTWYNESFQYNYRPSSYDTDCLNFTQLIWKASSSVGIGAATVGNFTVVVTKFVPSGNIRGRFKQNVIPPRLPAPPLNL